MNVEKNTKEYNEGLSETERLYILRKAKGGSWYDGWKPYHIEYPYNSNCSSPRMIQTSYGFKCPSCGAEIGWNLKRLIH